jgi:hypothetical protein
LNKLIEVIISPTGETKIETRGFTGSTCRQASAYLEQALGAQSSERLTSDFYESELNHAVNKEGQA